MKIKIIQTIVNTLDEARNILSTATAETYTISPDVGKCIKDLVNNKIYSCTINIGSKNKLKNYIEIDSGEE